MNIESSVNSYKCLLITLNMSKQLFEIIRVPSIPNAYKAQYILSIKNAGYEMKLYYVFEKVDGCNFMFVCDGKTILCGKRNSFLGPNDTNFHGYERLLEKYREDIMEIYDMFVRMNNNIKMVCIHYELYGGIYPGVKSSGKGVNKNVFYSPDINVIVFDVSFVFYDGGRWREWVPYDVYEPVLRKFDIPYLKPLFKGTLKEALDFPNKFVTTIPKMHGLPEIEDNIAEGTVIKPVETLLLKNKKVVIKNKCDKFSERRKDNALSYEEVGAIHGKFEGIIDYINLNRLSTVISKIGKVTRTDVPRIMRDFQQDILDSYFDDNEDLADITEEERDHLNKVIGTNGYRVVNKYIRDQVKETKQARREKKQQRHAKKEARDTKMRGGRRKKKK